MGSCSIYNYIDGFNTTACFDKLCEKYESCEEAYDGYGGTIANTNFEGLVTTFDKLNKKTEKEAEKLRDEVMDILNKREVKAIRFRLGVGVIKFKKEIIKGNKRSVYYDVEIYVRHRRYDRKKKIKGLRNAIAYVEKMIGEMDLDDLVDAKFCIESYNEGGKKVTYTPELKIYRKLPKKLPKLCRYEDYYHHWFFGWAAC